MSDNKNVSVRPGEVTKPLSTVINIVVMGTTGTGKTAFINLASDARLVVGHSLSSCTQNVQEAPSFKLDDRTINLIDTPGFDDTDRSEVQILKTIASYLEEKYHNGVKLHGIIYLQGIDVTRMGGASRRAFGLFRKLCGTENLKNVSIVTNRWDKVKPQEGDDREKELSEKYFKDELKEGAKLLRHDGTKASANKLLRNFFNSPAVALHVQEELVIDEKHVFETEAGFYVENDLNELIERAKKEEGEDGVGSSEIAPKLKQYLADVEEIREAKTLAKRTSRPIMPSQTILSSKAPLLGKLNLFTNEKSQKTHTKSSVLPQLQNPDISTKPHPAGSPSGLSVQVDQKEEPVDHVHPHLPHTDHPRTSIEDEEKCLEGSQGSDFVIQPDDARSPDHTCKKSQATSFSKSEMFPATLPQKPAVSLNSPRNKMITVSGEVSGAASKILTGSPLYESPLNEEGLNSHSTLSNGVSTGTMDLPPSGELYSQHVGTWEQTLERGKVGTMEHNHTVVTGHITVDKPENTLSVTVEDNGPIRSTSATTTSNLNLATSEAKSALSSTRRKKIPESHVNVPQDLGKQVPSINGHKGSTSKDTVTHGRGDLILGPSSGVPYPGAVVSKQDVVPFKVLGDMVSKEVQSQRGSPNGNKSPMLRDSVEKVESSKLSSEGSSSVHTIPETEAVPSAKMSDEIPKSPKLTTQGMCPEGDGESEPKRFPDVEKGEHVMPRNERSSLGTITPKSRPISSDQAGKQSDISQDYTLDKYGKSTEKRLLDGKSTVLSVDTELHLGTTVSRPQVTLSKKSSVEVSTEGLHDQQIADSINGGEKHVGSSATEPGSAVQKLGQKATLPKTPTTEEQGDPTAALTDKRLQASSEKRGGSQTTYRVVGQQRLSEDLGKEGQAPEVHTGGGPAHTQLPTQSKGQGTGVSSPQTTMNTGTGNKATKNNVQVAEVKKCTCSWWARKCGCICRKCSDCLNN